VFWGSESFFMPRSYILMKKPSRLPLPPLNFVIRSPLTNTALQ
jgi:hypothetical protein